MVPMVARYSSKANRPNSMCSVCNGWIDAGTEILFDRNARRSQHKDCPTVRGKVPAQLATDFKPVSNERVKAAGVAWVDAPLAHKSPEMGAALLVMLLTPTTRAFLDANDPKSVEQARNALRDTVLWSSLLQGESFNAERALTAADKTIFDDVAPFVAVAPAPTELDGYKAALANARAAGDAAAVAALEASIAAAEAPKVEERKCIRCGLPAASHEQHVLEDHENRTLAERAAPSQYSRPVDPDDGDALNPAPPAPVAPAPAPRAARPPAAPAMGARFSAQRGRRIARADAPAPKPTKVERDDLPF